MTDTWFTFNSFRVSATIGASRRGFNDLFDQLS